MFGPAIEALGEERGIAYKTKGDIGQFLVSMFKDKDYYFLAVEFGTYSSIRMLGALRAENRANFFSKETGKDYKSAKAELLECFCPASSAWRSSVLEQGVEVVLRAFRASVNLPSTT